MAHAGIDDKMTAVELKHETILIVDPNAPLPGIAAFKRLWFPDAIVTVALNAFEKVVDSFDGFLVTSLPVGILRPCPVVPELLHATALRRASLVAGRRFFLVAFFSALAINCAISSSVCS